jgi:cell division transport system permease protein
MGFVRFLGFTVVRAWQGFWRNAMMSLAATATVVLMLVLLSGLYIVLTGLNSGLQFIESRVGVTARLIGPPDDRELGPGQISRLVAQVERMPGVAEVTYVSPDDALERLREVYRERGETLELGGAEDRIRLYPSIEIALDDPTYASSVAEQLTDRAEVERITTRQSEYEKLLGIIELIRNVGVVAVGLVGLTVLFMIVNTIRIAVFNRAGEIEIMRLVGASDSFIRWPFILEGMLCGLIGAILAIVLVSIVWPPIQPIMFEVFRVPVAVGAQFLATLSVLLLAVGLGVGAVGSWISVRSYLSAAR